ncbi:hypothetical protein GE061_019751 [Apolygus lucorum]|uniref:Uncharacterized protein n=1 Tax=Apolygus lucorum TaxID=248454 RepID=A0A6A4JL75_APOLU|nr:hypothetical protein GE061_019751 [Apolygus lucorum]
MNGSQQFGIYRESAGKHAGSASRRFCCSFVIFLVIALVVCLTALSITTGKGRRKLNIHSDRNADVKKAGPSVVNTSDASTVTSHVNVTEETQTTSEPSLSRPEIASSSLRFPDEEESAPTTVIYLPEENEPYLPDGDLELFASRQGRIMNEPSISPYKMRGPPRFPNSLPTQERPNSIILFSSVPDFEDSFAQMGPYKQKGLKTQHEILDFAADDRPIPILSGAPAIKFTGVYVKGPAEEIENFSLDKKKTHLNGHAYSAVDPFKAYKPSHPSEINHLATTSSDFDTGPRFSNKIVRATTPPIDADPDGSSGMITQAIFHPYETGSGAASLPSTVQKPDKNGRPLKIMLDIYPLRPDSTAHGSAPEPVRQRKPVSPPRVQRHPAPPPPPPTQPNRMILHLNLFPNKSQKNSQRRTTPVPTLMTLVPGGGAHFQDRMFDPPDVTTEGKSVVAPLPPRQRYRPSNESVPDESMEIAETYPDIVVDGDERNLGTSEFILTADQTAEPSSPYDFVIGEVHRGDVQDDEGEVYVVNDEDEGVTQDYEEEDQEGRQGKSTFHEEENEGSKNGFKVVSFQVTSGDGEVIDDGGILRAQVNSDVEDEMKRVIDGSSGAGLTGMNGHHETPVEGDGVENHSDEGRKQHRDRVTGVKDIRIKQINAQGVGGSADFDRPVSDDYSVPIGTVSDTASELDFVPGYNEGAIIEPRVDLKRSWWPKSEMLMMNSSSTRVTEVFPTSPLPSTGENHQTTKEMSATDPNT